MEQTDTERRLTAAEDRAKSNSHRLDELERRQSALEKLVTSVEVLAMRQETVETVVKEIKSDVKVLTHKPAQRWDTLAQTLTTAVAAALAGFVMGHLGI